MLFMAVALCAVMGAMDAPRLELVDFGAETLPDFVVLNNTRLTRAPFEGGHAAEVQFAQVDWPNVFFKAPAGAWDWSEYAGIAVSLYNPTDVSVPVAMRVDNAGADGMNHCNNASGGVPPHGRHVISLRFNTGAPEQFWGMRGVPGYGPLGQGPVLDPAKIVAFQVFLPRPQREHTLIFEKAWLFGKSGAAAGDTPMPFMDRFGQYKHEDWPGKLRGEAELAARREAEEAVLAAAPALPGRDRFGGWADGPKREATGWFRTEAIDGKWWLITPEGTLFFSLGMDCVGTWELTFVEKRGEWFEWLPAAEETPFSGLYTEVSGAHSGADIIGGAGRAFSFYRANLIRKYGESWPELWRDMTYRRLSGWGFNTIANWAQADVLEHSPIPYVVSAGISGVPPIAGATGYWAKMMDVYDPAFPEAVDRALAWLQQRHAANPLCLGYFVDNELAWEGVSLGALNSPAEQPARRELLKGLQEKYDSIAALNAAWETDAETWEALRAPASLNAAAEADLDAFLYTFAHRYFQAILEAGRRYAPHQLYLGCRFASDPAPAVRACADVADVVSFNLYYTSIPLDKWTGADDLGKPIIIGEFHFGALDRGMFHTGLVATSDQNDRAAHYTNYVRSVADHPAFVGCHWFQYIDEPVTGRWFDGENYNIGFVDVTDTPYPELSAAACQAHADIYERRFGGKQ